MLQFLSAQPRCVVALEACGGSHHWGREIAKLGHEVRLISPKYVKPFVKRQKNDAADAEAICEAAQRQNMRFVAVKSAGAQANALVFRARDLLVRQRTQIINALRGHLTEYGYVAAKGPAHVAKLIAYIDDPESDLPEIARPILRVLIASLKGLNEQIAGLDVEIGRRAKEEPTARRLTPDHNPGHWPSHRYCDRGSRAPAGEFQTRPGLRRLGRVDTSAAFNRG